MSLERRPDPLEDPGREVHFHVERQVEDLVAQGWSEEDARAEALRRFGDPRRVQRRLERMGKRRRRTERRAAWWGGIRRDVAFSVRQIRRRPGSAAATVAVLALGVGTAAAVFAVVDATLLRGLPFPDPDALVSVQCVQDTPGYPASLPEFEDWEREGASIFSAAAALVPSDEAVKVGDLPEELQVGLVRGDLTAVTGLKPVVGRYFAPDERKPTTWSPVVMVDEDFWRTHMGGDPTVVGRRLLVDGRPVTVVGVMPRQARVLFGAADVALWWPLPALQMLDRGNHLLTVVGRLRNGLGIEAARPRVEAMAAGLRASGVTRLGVAIRPLREELLGGSRRVALILAGAALLVLLVVCANLAHLFLVRGRARGREFAVRGALGAGRAQIVHQLLTEAFTLGVLGGIGGVIVARAITRWVAGATGHSMVIELTRDGGSHMVLFALVTSLVLGLVFGWVPARRAASSDPGSDLRGPPGTVSAVQGRVRRVLVGVEVTLSVVLLIGAGLLVRTVERLVHQDVGFSAGGVLTASVDLPGNRYGTAEARMAFWNHLTDRLRALPGVVGVGLSSNLPFTGDTNGGFDIVGRSFPKGASPHCKKRFVSRDFFKVLGIPVVQGRGFLPSDIRGGPEVALVSESIAKRYWPGENPIGKHIRFLWQTNAEQEIVGVVGDVRSDALDASNHEGTIYLDYAQIGTRAMDLALKTSVPPRTLAEALRRVVAGIDGDLPVYGIRTLDSIVRGSVSDRTTVMQLLAAFAALALLLAAVGVYAVAAQSVATRTREIGVRIAVGARPAAVMRRVVIQELTPAIVGLLVGVIASMPEGRALEGMLYQVSPMDAETLAAVTLVLLCAAVAAVTLPALRAMHVDPSVALRAE